MTERADVSTSALARVVSRDPALVAKILRTVNSGVGPANHKVGNLDRAELMNVIGDVKGKRAIIVDAEIDTGGTLVEITIFFFV